MVHDTLSIFPILPSARSVIGGIGLFLGLLVIALAAVMAPPATASTFEFEIHPYDGSNLFCSSAILDQESSDVPVSTTVTQQLADVVSHSTGTYEARSDRGIVGMRMALDHQVHPPFGRLLGSCSSAGIFIDDFVIEGPPGTISIELNAVLDGIVERDTLSTRSQMSVRVGLTAYDGGGSVRSESARSFDVDVLTEAELGEALSSGPITFQVGDRLEAELSIEMTVVGGAMPDNVANLVDIDFLDLAEGYGLHFREAEVLSLPPGYTVNSVDGNVGGNVWGGIVSTPQRSWGALKSRFR